MALYLTKNKLCVKHTCFFFFCDPHQNQNYITYNNSLPTPTEKQQHHNHKVAD